MTESEEAAVKKLPCMFLGLAGQMASAAVGAAVLRTAAVSRLPVPVVGVPVTFRWQGSGGVLTLTATTHKRSAECLDRWWASPSLPLTFSTVADLCLPGGASYVSRATVAVSALAADTTYTFSYSIVMKAGDNRWVGSGSVAFTIGVDGALSFS